MFYGAFPPEFNSGRMYTGPGAESLVAAATAWENLATELQSTASSYSSVISSLTTGPWVGPSSLAMAAAAAPYVAWMQQTAAQAAQTAAQATEAATAYETAFAAHVPPPVIAANRALLAQLVATNLFGQNTAAIAATEAQYSEMWAQDAMAMDTYFASSATASNKLAEFSPAPQTTNAAGTAMQAAALTTASNTAAGNVASTVTQAASTTGATGPLAGLADLATAYQTFWTNLLNTIPGGASFYTAMYNAVKVPLGLTTTFNDIGLADQLPGVAVAQVRPTRRLRRAPERRAGRGARGVGLQPGHTVQRDQPDGGFCAWHLGGGVDGSAELGLGHPGHQDGGRRLVGCRARGRAGGRARRGKPVQFDGDGRDAGQRPGLRGSHRGPGRYSQPDDPDQRPQRQAIAGTTEASGRTDIGEARKRAAPHRRPRGSRQPCSSNWRRNPASTRCTSKRATSPKSCPRMRSWDRGQRHSVCCSDLSDRDPAWSQR